MPVDQNYMELFFIIDGLIRSGAQTVTAVIPYLGYQRQDHVFRDGEAVSLDVVIRTLESVGADQVVTFDLHSIKIPEVFTIPVKHLSALPRFANKIKELGEGILVSPDMGGLRRISKMSELLDGMDWIATVKDRDLDTGQIVIEKIEEMCQK
jgi:ribose-phosphate pyrophosphokinase